MVQQKVDLGTEKAVESVEEITSPPVEQTKKRTRRGEEEASPKNQQQKMEK